MTEEHADPQDIPEISDVMTVEILQRVDQGMDPCTTLEDIKNQFLIEGKQELVGELLEIFRQNPNSAAAHLHQVCSHKMKLEFLRNPRFLFSPSQNIDPEELKRKLYGEKKFNKAIEALAAQRQANTDDLREEIMEKSREIAKQQGIPINLADALILFKKEKPAAWKEIKDSTLALEVVKDYLKKYTKPRLQITVDLLHEALETLEGGSPLTKEEIAYTLGD